MNFSEIRREFFGKDLSSCKALLQEFPNHKYYEKLNNLIENEKTRLNHLHIFENDLKRMGNTFVAGVDEAGRGPLAGPIIAACVILPDNFYIYGIDDSKKLTEERREHLFDVITKKALAIGIGIVDQKEIDDINIGKADNLAMKKAIESTNLVCDHILSDAFIINDISINQTPLIKGDARSISIAAASIVAKVTRDRIMADYHDKYPQYSFLNNKGYGTKEHIEAIQKHGICPIHRKTFVKNIL